MAGKAIGQDRDKDELVLFESPPLNGGDAKTRVKAMEERIAKLEKINRVLMRRVERTVDTQGNPYSLFQSAILFEDVVTARTSRLQRALEQIEQTNRELRTAKEMAEEADLSKTRFLAAATHDLLQPLNAARLSLSILHDDPADRAAPELIVQTERSLETVDRLLRALLDISKLDAGVMRPHIGGCSLSKMFESLRTDFSATAAARGLQLRVCDSSLIVRSDAVLLYRIIQNFVANALRYTKEGKVLVGCMLQGDKARIGVWDTGIGIDPDEHEAIFEEFYRIATDDDQAAHRLGLGLAIVARIARVLGHENGIWSEPGKGSAFWVDVPIKGRMRASAPGDGKPVLGHDRLLQDCVVAVVEDEASVLAALDMRLQRWGCKTIVARNADDLLEKVAQASEKPDIVVADYHLGDDRTGLDAIQAIRQLDMAQLPAIVVTANHSPALHQRVLLANCQPMKKPVNPAELRSLMAYLINVEEGAAIN
jgi:signal transduction histidine kinase/CheY-like chemotaxis protein